MSAEAAVQGQGLMFVIDMLGLMVESQRQRIELLERENAGLRSWAEREAVPTPPFFPAADPAGSALAEPLPDPDAGTVPGSLPLTVPAEESAVHNGA